ncbi:hypothetical protein CAEBREN_10865 [Caenorhabditis brenneri]|uniref:Uncharacterized protein n=1 Tax=Caenorhabditis brenneri TaxID=135651 RepID=G0PK46_CAEBE|nr:hypothetical protein CAEBREN_10865 [Caenorhabditis brenneri]
MNVFNQPALINKLCAMPGWQLKNLNREICAAYNTSASDIYVTCNTVAGYFHLQIMEQFTAVDPTPDPIQEAFFPTVVIPFAKSLSIEDRIRGESKATWFKDVPYHFKNVFINFNKGQVTIDGIEVSKGFDDLCRVFLKYFIHKLTTIQVMEILGAWDLFICKAQIKELILHYPGPLPPLFLVSLLHNKLEKLTVDTLEEVRNAPDLMKNAKEVVVLGGLPSSSNINSIIANSTNLYLENI